MKKKVLAVIMGVLFVADVVMTLFNIDIFTRFLKEKRKENDERIRRRRYAAKDYASYSSYYRPSQEDEE